MITPNFKKPNILSVSQLNFYIKSLLENDPALNTVFLSGEISNLTDHYRSGHIYLSLKDERSVIRAVMFAGNARRLRFRPENGMKVLCRGRVSLYEPSGQYQLYIEDMQPDGVGALTLAFEQLKKKLEAEGLFSPAHKKPLPRFPGKVGVITSPTGAAVQDIRNILYRRYPCIDVVMCPVLVQGEGAPAQLTQALEKLDSSGLCDVIIIGRGGGSMEDLWAFNSEALARAIYNCSTPVISAVGHETDFTICDFVADMRAPTPSAAAELAVPDCSELKSYWRSQQHYLSTMIDNCIRYNSQLQAEYSSRLDAVSPMLKCETLYEKIRLTGKRLTDLIDKKYSNEELKLKETAAKLHGFDPLAILSRGYTITEQDGKTVASASTLDKEKDFELIFSDGKITAKATGE